MNETHICQGCGHRCPRVHPFCIFCRNGQRAEVDAFVARAEAALESADQSERISPVIVRQVDAILARQNRQDARARWRASRSFRLLVLLGWSLFGSALSLAALVREFAR